MVEIRFPLKTFRHARQCLLQLTLPSGLDPDATAQVEAAHRQPLLGRQGFQAEESVIAALGLLLSASPAGWRPLLLTLRALLGCYVRGDDGERTTTALGTSATECCILAGLLHPDHKEKQPSS
jgi:hypothetical protein